MKKLLIITSALLLSACGDFPDYRFDETENYCVMSFAFAGGFFDRKYIGYLNITSTLQYLDAEPEIEIFIGEPSHIELEVGSVIRVELGDQGFTPQFEKRYMQGELQYWGPAFIFDKQQSLQMYQLMQQGYGPTIVGRFEVGARYEADIYNFFFESNEEPFRNCVNRLLDPEDFIKLEENRKRRLMSQSQESTEPADDEELDE